MLSILIPTYAYNAFPLVESLYKQALHAHIDFELLCWDNGSASKENVENQKINQFEHCQFKSLENNGGRSKIRNDLAKAAQYEALLFLDADVAPVDEDFLVRYVACIGRGERLVFGGLKYQDQPPEIGKRLRWVFGKAREEIALEQRQAAPAKHFTSANFLIRRKDFLETGFDEDLVEYGFEDALLARQLESKGLLVNHIENEVFHLGIDRDEVFVEKTRAAMNNLRKMRAMGKVEAAQFGVVHWAERLDALGISPIYRWKFNLFRPFIEKNLGSSNPKLLYYDLFKLGVYLSNKGA